MEFEFTGEVWEWRGPSPFFFVTVPDEESAELEALSSAVTYGWGMIPVDVTIGTTHWTTSLYPKDGRYVVPLKNAVRQAQAIALGDMVNIRLDVAL